MPQSIAGVTRRKVWSLVPVGGSTVPSMTVANLFFTARHVHLQQQLAGTQMNLFLIILAITSNNYSPMWCKGVATRKTLKAEWQSNNVAGLVRYSRGRFDNGRIVHFLI